MTTIQKLPVLGTPVAVVDYTSAIAECQRLAREPRPAAVAASNTHIISLARHTSAFGETMRRFDLVLPDGMPLRWALNAQGADLKDRVYGPYFMQRLVAATPAPWKHFLFGGTPETLDALATQLKKSTPGLDIVGRLSPPFRDWTEADEAAFAKTIADSRADFIWVALGGN